MNLCSFNLALTIMFTFLAPYGTDYLCPIRDKNCNLSDCIGTRTHDHLVLKRTLNHLAKLVKCVEKPICLNAWVFVYKLSGCGFGSCCSHLNFRFRAYFEQGVPWHSGNYRVWIHSETRTWHDKNIQLEEVQCFV